MNLYMKYLLGGMLVMAASACSEEELMSSNDQVATQGERVTVMAYVPSDNAPISRITLTEEESNETPTISVAWADEDEFSVIRGNENQTFNKANGENTFTGTLPDVDGSGNYYAFYPKNPSLDITDVTIDLWQGQNGELNPKNTYMYAVSEDGKTFKFKHLTALLKPTFKGIPEGHTVKSVNILSDVATRWYHDLTTGDIEMRNDYNIKTFSKLPNYIYLPPMAVGKKLEFVVTTNEGGAYVAILTTKKAIEAGKLYSSTIQLGEPTRTEWQPGIASVQPSGEGTEESPYLVANAYNLQWLVDNDYKSEGKFYQLTTDITINGKWIPIGDDAYNSFKGTFDGNSKTIGGTMEFDSSYSYHCGLFCYNAGTIKNLTMNVSVNGKTTYSEGSIGSVAGYNKKEGIITNCTNNGTMTGERSTSSSKTSYVGGIVGYNLGTVKGCINEGEITGVLQGVTSSGTKSYAGGIVGYQVNGIISSCYNYAIVKGNNANALSAAGGITGTIANGILEGCTNRGAVIGYTDNDDQNPLYNHVGGIIGCDNGADASFVVLGCVNHGTLMQKVSIPW